MAYIIPNGRMVLCGDVGIDNSYENTGYFANATDQFNYFYSKKIQEFEGLSYQRVDSKTIRVNAHYPIVYNASYMMFKNTEFHENKWFYAFVNKITYINDNCCEFTYEIDVIQTWYFDTHYGECLIERNHIPTSEDIIGLQIMPEGLETGDYFEKHLQSAISTTSYVYVLVCTVDLHYDNPESTDIDDDYTGEMIGKYYSGCRYYAYTDPSGLSSAVKRIGEHGKQDSIVCIYQIPAEFYTEGSGQFDLQKTLDLGSKTSLFQNLFEGYTPRNNKLYSYPYCFIYGTNYNGVAGTYPIEYFRGTEVQFRCYFDYSPQATFIAMPMNYKGNVGLQRTDDMLCTGGFPQCSANVDTYKAWLAQNSNTLNQQELNALNEATIGVGTGIAGAYFGALPTTGVGVSEFSRGLSNYRDILAKKRDVQIKPPTMVGSFNPTNITQINANLVNIGFSVKSIQQQFARAIDDYFTMFGYQVNVVEVPRIANRSQWTYIKTCGCIIHGNAPSDDIAKLEAIHDKGIRYWRDLNNVGNFSLPNV